MLAWCRSHPMVARNALFVLFAVPMAVLVRAGLAEAMARSVIMGALAPILAIMAGLVLAKLVADRLGIPRR